MTRRKSRNARNARRKGRSRRSGGSRRPRRSTEAIRTDQGVASRSRRGAFVESWWAERWVAALERLVRPARLARGQQYARAGQVLSLREEGGTVHARVQGSRRRPYDVTVGLAPLSDAAWGRVIAALAKRPDLAASLLAGEMPRGIGEVFAPARASLFPSKSTHLRLTCSCPDEVAVCKHVAATCYLLGEQLDEDPFLLFRLRGRDQDELLEGLRRRVGAGPAANAAAEATSAAPLTPDDFWTAAAPPPRIDLPGERPDLSLLRRLGPFSALDDDLVARLGPIYRSVASAAEAAFEVAEAESADEDDG